MDYCFQTIHKLLEIMKMPEFYLIIVNSVSCVAVNVTQTQMKLLCFTGRVTNIAPLQYLLCMCMSVWVSSGLCCSNMWSCVCCCPLHPACECMTDRCQACHGLPGRCVYTMCRDRERWKVVERRELTSLSFYSGFPLSDMHPHPVYCLSASANDWQTNCSATDRSTSRLLFCLCTLCTWKAYASVNTGKKNAPAAAFVRSAYLHSDDQAPVHTSQPEHTTQHNGACCLLAALSPLQSLTDSTLAISMLTAFQKLDFTNGKTASAFLQLHIWRP